ncbi:S1 family peptidase [Streptomyces sp. NRRL F-2747]|uniref:S1 family peptidase n=1 Tax=Streptomyces sp. NRRL F-2747 TaxID=1463843 RepID=UPI0022770A8C|nr:S1 family peptidase [Streptomyces sp. NRRL F-2747]
MNSGRAHGRTRIEGTTIHHGYAVAARLNVGDKEACSGALVDAQWVITAASCFSGGTAQLKAGKPAVKTTVTVGRTDLTQSTGTVVEAVELVPHTDRDLVMVKLAWRVVGVEPVKVATKAPVVGEQLTSLGFGRTKTEWVPDEAHIGAFSVASPTGDAITLDATGDAVVCKGDTGGPALRRNDGGTELSAVNSRSWRGGCLGTDPAETRTSAADVRVDDVAAWIEQARRTTPEVRLQGLVPHVTKVMTTGDFNGDGRDDFFAIAPDGALRRYDGDGKTDLGGLWNEQRRFNFHKGNGQGVP